MMAKKFELALETEESFFGVKMFRIRALISFSFVRKGDLGGFVQSEFNLSQEGNAWIYNDAKVSCDARVYGNANIYGNARVFDDACVFGDARVSCNAEVYGEAHVYNNARVFGNACVYDNAKVYGNAQVSGNARVFGDARVYGNALFYGNAKVYDNAKVYGNAQVSGTAIINKNHQIKNVTNLKWSFTSLPKGVQVGCEFYSMKDWAAKHLEVGTKHGLSPEMSKEYFRLMKAVRRIQRLEAKELKMSEATPCGESLNQGQSTNG